MELELGLALPFSSSHFSEKNFDLNINKNALLALQEQQSKDNAVLKNAGLVDMEFKNLMMIRPKRSLDEAFGIDDENKTLSLLVWDGRRPNGGEDGRGQEKMALFRNEEEEEEDDEIVGWPPIKSWRKRLLQEQGHQERIVERANVNVNFNVNGVRKSIFVKVKMEGVVIGRKIDLTLFNSYESLTNTLLNMFAKYRNNDKDEGPYVLSYLDKEGDWLLAGDVPWQIFIESVQRMAILKRSS